MPLPIESRRDAGTALLPSIRSQPSPKENVPASCLKLCTPSDSEMEQNSMTEPSEREPDLDLDPAPRPLGVLLLSSLCFFFSSLWRKAGALA